MKKLLLMTIITITCFLAGVLYGGYTHQERKEEIQISQEYLNYYRRYHLAEVEELLHLHGGLLSARGLDLTCRRVGLPADT